MRAGVNVVVVDLELLGRTFDPSERKEVSFPRAIDKVYHQHNLAEKFPERFDLSIATKVIEFCSCFSLTAPPKLSLFFSVSSQVFESFMSSWSDSKSLETAAVFFKLGELTYRGDISQEVVFIEKKKCCSTRISLPNNGFLYPHPTSLKVR